MLVRPAPVRLTRRLTRWVAFAAFPLIACAQASSQSVTSTFGGGRPANLAAAPKLIVAITVDQMRYDYLERFADQYQGGLARLINSRSA